MHEGWKHDRTPRRPTTVAAAFPDSSKAIAALFADRPMNLAEQRESFAALIREHEPLRSPKLKLLLELRESISEARKKGASHETIRSYLHQTGIEVSTDTVARFCHQILGERKGKKSGRHTAHRHVKEPSAAAVLKQKRINGSQAVRYQPPTGPRIVNPKAL